ncbi:MAG: chorismate mutase [Treponema sp.]|nr:chorismate mutase [Treponema sp.]
MKKLYALRGAVQCENKEDDIIAQVALMYDELLKLNSLAEAEIVSIMFSVTNDINVLSPCTALRKEGRAAGGMALFASQEPEVKNSLERTIRVIIHCYLEEESKPCHVYLNGAEVLRPDRVKK